MELLLSYHRNHFFPARREIAGILRALGDPSPAVTRTGVMGMAVVSTSLDNREVVRKCKSLFATEDGFQHAIKLVPIDFWCETDLDAMKKVIEENVRGLIGEGETWAMKVEKRRWQKYHTIEIIRYLAESISQKVNLRNPDKLVRIDIVGRKTAVSVLKPGEIFSVGLP